MKESEALSVLDAGMQILEPVMQRHGFLRSSPLSGSSSGGVFASSEWIRANRGLGLHFRYSLGLVIYHVRDISISHEDYMWAVTGRRFSTAYPGFSADPLDGFRHLRADLERHASSFLLGSDEEFFKDVGRAKVLKQGTLRLPS